MRFLTVIGIVLVLAPSTFSSTIATAKSTKARIAFILDDDNSSLNIVDYDGSDRHILAKETTGNFAWSPDGKAVAYTASDGLYTVNVDGSNPTNMISYQLGGNTLDPQSIDDLAWLPMKNQIIFHSRKPSFINVLAYFSANVKQNDSSAIGGGVCYNPKNGTLDWKPPIAWSPDGTRVLVVFDDHIYACNWERASADLVTGDMRGADSDPSWSADGKLIVFSSTRDHPEIVPADYFHDVFMMNADGTNQRNLTYEFGKRDEPSRADSFMPALSSDGRRLAFSSSLGGRHSIYLMNIATGVVRRLTDPGNDVAPQDAWDDYYPQWSPDGDYISYTARRNFRNGVNVIDLVTGHIYSGLFTTPSEYAWQP